MGEIRWPKIIQVVYENQPITKAEIKRKCGEIPKNTIDDDLRTAKNEGLLKQDSKKRYCFSGFKEGNEKIKEAIIKLKKEYLGDPTIKEIAMEIGKDYRSEKFRKKAIEIGHKVVDWKDPTLREGYVKKRRKAAYTLLTLCSLIDQQKEAKKLVKASSFLEKFINKYKKEFGDKIPTTTTRTSLTRGSEESIEEFERAFKFFMGNSKYYPGGLNPYDDGEIEVNVFEEPMELVPVSQPLESGESEDEEKEVTRNRSLWFNWAGIGDKEFLVGNTNNHGLKKCLGILELQGWIEKEGIPELFGIEGTFEFSGFAIRKEKNLKSFYDKLRT